MGMLERLFGLFGEKEAPKRVTEALGVTVDADEEEGWRRLSGDVSRDLSPLSQERMRETAYYLWDSNLVANRLIELPLAYLLAEGVALQAADKSMQKVLDRFWSDPINSFDEKLEKKVRELALFGEQCYPAFVNEVTGHVRLGYLDPGLIATVVVDPDNPEQPIGIVTKRDKRGRALKYKVIVNGPEDVFTQRTREIRESFDDGECFYFQVNALSTSRRGRSDLRAPADWVDAYDQFLFGEAERYNFLRAFVWDVTMKGATPEQVAERAKTITAPSPGSVRVHNDGEAWNAVTPQIQAYESAAAGRLFRNHVLGGATIPEHWFGGGGDVNRSTGESMGEPTFKVFTMRQRVIRIMLQTMGRYAIRRHLLAGNSEEPPFDDPRLTVQALFPEMTARDTTKYAAALVQLVTAVNMAIEAALLTEETGLQMIAAVAAQFGVEIDAAAELKKARKAAADRAEGDTFTGPAAADIDDGDGDGQEADQA